MKKFTVDLSNKAKTQFCELINDPGKVIILKSVSSALLKLEVDPFYPSLNSQLYEAIEGHKGEKIFESYAQNNTPGAYRIFWHYGPGRGIITVELITPHIQIRP